MKHTKQTTQCQSKRGSTLLSPKNNCSQSYNTATLFSRVSKKKSERGAAIMMALFFFTIVMFVVTQMSSETLTESVIASRELKKVKSYYSAKAGMEVALLRIKAYLSAKESLGSSNLPAGAADQALQMILQFPLPWPIVLPEDSSVVLKDDGEKVLKKSLISNLTFFHEIQDAGNKVDINSLGYPVENISEKTLNSLLISFTNALEEDQELSKEHSLDSIKEVLNNIADWIDMDQDSRNGGGNEQGLYTDESQRGYPRNSDLMSFSELMLIHKMDDMIFNYLQKFTTLHGTFGINVNTADKETIMAISTQFTEELVTEFIRLRDQVHAEGAQLNETTFDNILNEIGISNIQEIHSQGVPLLYAPQSVFTVVSTGTVGSTSTTITAHVVHTAELKQIYIDQLAETKNNNSKNTTPGPTQTQNNNNNQKQKAAKVKAPQGKPKIVWLKVE